MIRNQVRVQVRYKVTIRETSQIDHIKTYSNYIRNKPTRPVSAKGVQLNKLVVTIV